ncbi:MAG TPA: hypothetical protein VGG69_03910 [Rhizomicrobium sp.]
MSERSNSVGATWIPRYLIVALLAGLAASVIEMVFVLPVQPLFGTRPIEIFWIIAAGFLGKAALHGGAGIVALGMAIHVFVSVVAAAVYVFASRLWDDVLIRKPIISGMTFGAVCYVVMTFVVIPLSALRYHPDPSLADIWTSVAIHIFGFGLPIALVSRALLYRSSPLAQMPA